MAQSPAADDARTRAPSSVRTVSIWAAFVRNLRRGHRQLSTDYAAYDRFILYSPHRAWPLNGGPPRAATLSATSHARNAD
jgi:hypothetical protein